MAKVFTISIMPDPGRRKGKPRKTDPRFIEGQKILVEAIKYLTQQDRKNNKAAISLLSEHFRTRFRMTDRPNPASAKPREAE
jgi:hypothetical protein